MSIQLLPDLQDQNTDIGSGGHIVIVYDNDHKDALSIATPNHWHALATIWACQAGKDVYVEKPVSHNVWEGRKMVEAARRYNRIVQTGTQSRSSRQGIAAAVQWVRAGHLGKIRVARGLCYKRRDSIGKVDGPQPIPPEVDYDLWCGPAPKDPLMRNGASTTTGTGSGPPATATSATRAFTRWTSLSEGTYQLGRTLQIDSRREKIVKDEEANAMLTREYRAPFVVPTSV
jgi:hypothetical protein